MSDWPFTPEETDFLFNLATAERSRLESVPGFPEKQHRLSLANDCINKLFLQDITEEEMEGD